MRTVYVFRVQPGEIQVIEILAFVSHGLIGVTWHWIQVLKQNLRKKRLAGSDRFYALCFLHCILQKNGSD